MKILFINRELGHAGKSRRMQGFHGTNYGTPSCWNQEYQGQVVTLDLTPKEYLAVIFDLARCWHMAMRKWIPVPIETPTSRAPEVIEFEAGYNLAMDGKPLPDGTSPAAKAGHELVQWQMTTETHRVAEGDPTAPEALIDPTSPTLPPVNAEIPKNPPIDNAHVAEGCEKFHTEHLSPHTPWFGVVKAAKDAGLNPADFQGDGRKTLLIEAINAKRKQPAGV